MAQALAANGASKVFIIGRRLEALQKTAEGGPDGTIIRVQGDITSKESLQAAYQTISSQIVEPSPKSLLNPPAATSDNLEEIREKPWSIPEDFSLVLQTNATGSYYTVMASLPLLDSADKR